MDFNPAAVSAGGLILTFLLDALCWLKIQKTCVPYRLQGKKNYKFKLDSAIEFVMTCPDHLLETISPGDSIFRALLRSKLNQKGLFKIQGIYFYLH
ncbi:hypothetical protein ADICYQ_3331 [Cyclobacterium qasimii M12-11B]|uniref:Uncharacterized protein n=1 Tax=Cyclobacterium qasimii M12-11B TaxID=641524 RepID=S7VCJ2_9BACT|nr:hypothetical protein ADICYQ_3331 [Cyclobacterium qasimii M12-11B]